MNAFYINNIIEIFTAKNASRPMAILGMIGMVIAGGPQAAGAAFTISPGTLRSTKPCLFAEQLKESASIRNQYTAKLIEARNGTVATSNRPRAKLLASNTIEITLTASDSPVTILPESDTIETTVPASITIGIDALSANCLGCHDGVGALEITSVFKNNPERLHLTDSNNQMIGMDHPIGMDYNRYVAASRGYKRLLGISDNMVFVNGKVGCLTCHDPLNSEKGHLVISDRNSALCYTCHDK